MILLVANRVRKFSTAPPLSPPATAVAPVTPSPEAPRESLAAKAESLRAAPSPPPQAPVESPPPPSDSAKPVAPTRKPQPVDAGAVQRRYANTWMNVRADRSNTAQVIRVLRPGEEVLVDLLKQGWYRVVTDSQAIGFVDQRYLDTMPPAAISH